MSKNNGRPKKHSEEEAKTLAKCFLDIKGREPSLSQECYSKNYGISSRTLRRYIQMYCQKQMLEKELEAVQEKLKEHLPEATDQNSKTLLVAWF